MYDKLLTKLLTLTGHHALHHNERNNPHVIHKCKEKLQDKICQKTTPEYKAEKHHHHGNEKKTKRPCNYFDFIFLKVKY